MKTKVCKIPFHDIHAYVWRASRIDVKRQRTTHEDKIGNDGADALAVAGAAMHEVSAEIVAAASLRKRNAVHVQQMMVRQPMMLSAQTGVLKWVIVQKICPITNLTVCPISKTAWN